MQVYQMMVVMMVIFRHACGRVIRKITEECKPRPVLFDLNMGSGSTPRYVELQRCMGLDAGYASNYRCVHVATKPVKGFTTHIKFYDHTKCAMKCACNQGQYASAGCDSLAAGEDVFCYPGNKWNHETCQCEPGGKSAFVS